MREITSSRIPLLLLLFRLLCLHSRNASCHHDVPNRRIPRSNQFGMEGAKRMAWNLVAMVGGACLLANLTKNMLTTTQQRLLIRCDLYGRQQPPWCPTPGATTDNSCPESCMIVVCQNARRGAPWQPCDDGGCHGRWGMD